MPIPRIVTGAMATIPGDWLTPPDKAGTAYPAHAVNVYVDGVRVERPYVVNLDAGEVEAELPDRPTVLRPPDEYDRYYGNHRGIAVPNWRPVMLVGHVEIRRELAPADLKEEIARARELDRGRFGI